jgi:hypothetical protein
MVAASRFVDSGGESWPLSADAKKVGRLFLRGGAFQLLSLVFQFRRRPLTQLATWTYHARQGGIKGSCYVAMALAHRLLRPLGLVEWLRRFLCALPGGYATPSLWCTYGFCSAVYYRFFHGRVPVHKLWWFSAALFTYQLWSQSHHMSPTYTAVLAKGCGLRDFDAINYRSRTRHIVPCDDAAHGLHPGESCARAAATALARGLPGLMATYAAVYSVKLVTGRYRLGVDFLMAYLRSVLMMIVQMHVGRITFCVQSHVWPHKHQPWLGAVMGVGASCGILLEDDSARRDVLLFNTANAILTLIDTFELQLRPMAALLFAVGSAIDVRKSKWFD